MQNRPDSETHPGGDTVQMEWTARFLRSLGHEVVISFELEPDLDGFDLVHLFNLTRPHETFVQAENARRQSKTYVLSSVYWDLESAVPWHAYEFPRNWWRRMMPETLRLRLRRFHGVGRCSGMRSKRGNDDPRILQASILQNARFVFPNSEAEKAHLLERFARLSPDRLHVVRNGVARPSMERIRPLHVDAKDIFVCAGAIGPRKNQLNLVKAFKLMTNERLLIIGRAAPGSERYHQAVIRAGGSNVSFHKNVPHDGMAAVFQDAKACVQPSFIETPGLSAMEAASLGVPIVVADVAPVREYFGELGCYCDPASARSIADACGEAWQASRLDGTAFRDAYEWDRVLEPMGRVYAMLESELGA